MSNGHEVTKQFEDALCDYTGAPYAVAVNSCTMALLLACAWHRVEIVSLPKHTYVGVPMSVIHAGGKVTFRDVAWHGEYQLRPYPIWDSARRFRPGMWKPGRFSCVSFHWSKILGLQQGGAILHGSDAADPWLRRARFDGRTEGVAPIHDSFLELGWHCYMSPEVAAAGLVRLAMLERSDDLPNSNYPDLSQLEIFK